MGLLVFIGRATRRARLASYLAFNLALEADGLLLLPRRHLGSRPVRVYTCLFPTEMLAFDGSWVRVVRAAGEAYSVAFRKREDLLAPDGRHQRLKPCPDTSQTRPHVYEKDR
jgi:hypothetical protein